MVTEKESEWCKLLDRLYGTDGALNARQFSLWWKDVKDIDAESSPMQGWFTGSVKLKLGDGRQVKFWQDKWCGPWQLMELFPRLFELAANQNGSVADAGEWSGNRWSWQLSWCRQLLSEEQAEVQWLEDTLKPICPDRFREDIWLWMQDTSLKYKVKTTYEYLIAGHDEAVNDDGKRRVFRRLWSTVAPSKFLVHA